MTAREQFRKTVYNTKRWKQLRLEHIMSHEDNALCMCCLYGHSFCCSGMTATEAATVSGYGKQIIEPMFIVDHVEPLAMGGDAWSLDNLRSYCLSCHSRKTKRIDSMMQRNAAIERIHDELEDFNVDFDNSLIIGYVTDEVDLKSQPNQ